MKIRKERARHQCGLTNMDFRTQKDAANIAKYQEDFRRTNFGTMGRTGVKIMKSPETEVEAYRETVGRKVKKPPNPKNDIGTMYYREQDKALRETVQVGKPRIQFLEETTFDERVLTGEHVGFQTWYKGKTHKDMHQEETTTGDKTDYKNLLTKGDKLDKHSRALQETQLVKVTTKESLAGKVDLEKVKDIRHAIRRRYGNRNDFRKIFNQWDRNRKGQIDSIDMHSMLNKLGMKVNINEARVLLASADKQGRNTLGMDDFLGLIFNTEEITVDLHSMPESNADSKAVEAETESMVKTVEHQTAKLKEINEENHYKMTLQRKIRELGMEFQSVDHKGTQQIDFPTFKQVLLKHADLPYFYKGREDLMQKLFNQFDLHKQGTVNHRNFVKSIHNFQYAHDWDELGPSAVELEGGIAKIAKTQQQKKGSLNLYEVQKVPQNQLEKIYERTMKINRILQVKYSNVNEFEKDLKGKVKFDNLGNADKEDLQQYFIDACMDNLKKRAITRRDLEGFLSSFSYNRHNKTDINRIPDDIFSDHIQTSNRLHKISRTMPPPKSAQEEAKVQLERISDNRMRNILAQIEDRVFTVDGKKFNIFREFDKDGDGYVSHDDMKKHLKEMKVTLNEAEFGNLTRILDPQDKGFLDFNTFAQTFTPLMSKTLVKENDDEETFLFKRDRQNLCPNREKIQENRKFNQTFGERFNNIRQTLLPDKNMLLNLKPSTRFGATPGHQDTFYNVQPPTTSGMYCGENDRLKAGHLNMKVTHLANEKQFKETSYQTKLQKKRDHENALISRIKEVELQNGIKDHAKIEVKKERFDNYEKKCHSPFA